MTVGATADRPIKFRGHHLICLQFFKGEGYSLEFVENLVELIGRLEAGAPGVVVAGADEVCASCDNMFDETCPFAEGAAGEITRLDELALELLEMSPGEPFDFAEIRGRLPGVLGRWRTEACAPCAWANVCLPLMELLER